MTPCFRRRSGQIDRFRTLHIRFLKTPSFRGVSTTESNNQGFGPEEAEMLLRGWRFAALLFTALTLSMSFCHLLEMPVKMTYGWTEYAAVQGIYRNFGGVGAILETGAVLLAITLCYLVRGRQPAFGLTLAGALCLAIGLGIWFALVAPVNVAWANASPTAPPADWGQLRRQWEYTHAARAMLHLIALATLQLSVILETPAPALRHARTRAAQVPHTGTT